MKTYCINLERRPDRRARIQKDFDREGLTDVEFFRAVDGKLEAPDDIFINKSEYGTAESHFRIYRDIVKHGYEYALVFEDDAHLGPQFISKLNSALQEASAHCSWDLLYLGYTWEIKDASLTPNIFIGRPLQMHAYVISLEGAKKLYNFNTKLLRFSFDFEVNNFPLVRLGLEEPIAFQSPSGSFWDDTFCAIVDGDVKFNRTFDIMHFIVLYFDYVLVFLQALLVLLLR